MSLDRSHDSDRGHDRQQPQPGHATPWEPEVHYRIVHSETGPSDDGYWQGEPKYLECEACGARVQLTETPSAGVDELPHAPGCSQRWAKSEWWRAHFD